jgi:hypothetical protein
MTYQVMPDGSLVRSNEHVALLAESVQHLAHLYEAGADNTEKRRVLRDIRDLTNAMEHGTIN